MYNLSPFEHFSEDMARMVTGRRDAPKLMDGIARKSYMLLRGAEGEYTFIPIVRQALFSEMRNIYTQDYINGQYKRAALYYELQNQMPQAINYYKRLNDVEKIRELLIRDTFNRPADGDYVNLREGYAMLDEETILAYPELMKGKCVIESLSGHARESDRWYEELEKFIRRTPVRDARRQSAEEAPGPIDPRDSKRYAVPFVLYALEMNHKNYRRAVDFLNRADFDDIVTRLVPVLQSNGNLLEEFDDFDFSQVFHCFEMDV